MYEGLEGELTRLKKILTDKQRDCENYQNEATLKDSEIAQL